MKDHPSQWIHSGLTCRDVTDRVAEYFDDRLPMFPTVRVGLHLASCAHCRTYVKQTALVSEAVASLHKQYPSPIQRLRLRQHFAARHAC